MHRLGVHAISKNQLQSLIFNSHVCLFSVYTEEDQCVVIKSLTTKGLIFSSSECPFDFVAVCSIFSVKNVSGPLLSFIHSRLVYKMIKYISPIIYAFGESAYLYN